jgi:uncharacterized C2H2 Zn-finger protein
MAEVLPSSSGVAKDVASKKRQAPGDSGDGDGNGGGQTGRHICHVCGDVFPTHKDMLWHCRFYHGYKFVDGKFIGAYDCGLCDERFTTRTDVCMHGKIFHNMYMCTRCFVPFLDRQTRDEHMRDSHELAMGRRENVRRGFIGCLSTDCRPFIDGEDSDEPVIISSSSDEEDKEPSKKKAKK